MCDLLWSNQRQCLFLFVSSSLRLVTSSFYPPEYFKMFKKNLIVKYLVCALKKIVSFLHFRMAAEFPPEFTAIPLEDIDPYYQNKKVS